MTKVILLTHLNSWLQSNKGTNNERRFIIIDSKQKYSLLPR